ncbi:hypothetical protein SAMN05216252_101213 [Actinacidiphila glaucinigra]|uniref:Uncharacterized protein n=1 Tax=Actinacidiphila glaucinigra TaxID=235986 RepID=A0A238ZG72_9ACTN|nr:hypothetical protein SAMN05216252_101213 [Actinacidiphila glaucinigra]
MTSAQVRSASPASANVLAYPRKLTGRPTPPFPRDSISAPGRAAVRRSRSSSLLAEACRKLVGSRQDATDSSLSARLSASPRFVVRNTGHARVFPMTASCQSHLSCDDRAINCGTTSVTRHASRVRTRLPARSAVRLSLLHQDTRRRSRSAGRAARVRPRPRSCLRRARHGRPPPRAHIGRPGHEVRTAVAGAAGAPMLYAATVGRASKIGAHIGLLRAGKERARFAASVRAPISRPTPAPAQSLSAPAAR